MTNGVLMASTIFAAMLDATSGLGKPSIGKKCRHVASSLSWHQRVMRPR
jgi:hypothetical protein